MTLATAAYAFGNCTYYVATRFPTIYPWLGNAKDWITNSKKQGYTILSKPAVDTVVVYGAGIGGLVRGNTLGHVAVVDRLNSDGSFQVTEMNWNGFDVINTRRSTMQGVIGFVVPPGSSYKPTSAVAAQAFSAATGSANNCVTGGPNLFGAQVCMDGLVGFAAMAAGSLLILGGVVVFAAFALNKSGLAEKVAGSVGPLAGPWGAVASLAVRTSKPKAKPVLPTAQEGKAASDARVAVAKQRLSASAESEVSEAKAGYGKRLSPEAREEINSQRSAA